MATGTETFEQRRVTAPTVRDAVIDLLRRLNMTSVFANPGSTELPLFRHFPDDFRYVLGLQEAVVVGMADGFAQATRNAAFVNLHSAAGVGNAMGNIFTAFKNRTPLVITAGQQARSSLPFDPFLASREATELPKPYVKWSIEPARAEDVPHAIARAYYIAMTQPCGPVLVSVPVDDWDRPAEYLPTRVVSQQVRPDPAILHQIGSALDRSKQPAFVVGAAVDRDGAFNEVRQLAEAHNARVFTAPMSGRGSFPEDHRLFAGFLPAIREKIVHLLQGHDLVFAIGAPAFSYHVEGFGPHLPDGAELFQLTDDPQERRTVMQLVEKASKERIYPVGRLDRNTTGLLLMTNDGDLADKLSHPKNNIVKLYHAELNKSLTQGDLNKISFGLELEDGLIKPDAISYVQGGTKREVGIQIHSGKNRIVRRIFEHLGYEVVKLDRAVYANLTKKDLPRGRWRYLDEKEIVQLKHLI